MAGDWIKVEHATPDKPEVVKMAIILGIEQDAVVGKLLRIWVWADDNSVDGHELSVTDAFLDRLTHCPGFAAALRSVGWLEGRDCLLSIPNFTRHNGQSAKSRALGRDRKQMSRSRHISNVTETRPEKSREENISPPITHTRAEPQWQQHVAEHVEGCELTEAQAIEQAHTAGVPEDFAKYVYGDWWSREGRDAGGVKTAYIRLCRKRWTREQKEWEKGTHKGKRTHENSRTGSQSRIGGTYDPDGTIASQYRRGAK